ncbi:MAG: hypothetical protein PHE84_07005 [bacterium]|nr:hypothetical protein [bacterium]
MMLFRISPESRLAFFFLAFFLLFFPSTSAFPADTEGRAVFNLGYDDNVFDDTSNQKNGDFLYRIVLEGRTLISLPRTLALSGSLWNGAEFFTREESENRLRQKLNLRLGSENRFLTAFLKGTLETSFFPWKENYYYFKPGTEFSLVRNLSPVFRASLTVNYQYFGYHPESDLSYQFLVYSGLIESRIRDDLRAELSGAETRRWNKGEARRLDQQSNLVSAGFARDDLVDELSLALAYSPRYFLRAAYNFQKGTSNSYGLSFQTHRTSLTFSYPLPTKTILHLFGVVQVKKYTGLGTYTIWAEDRRIILADEQDENLNAISVRVEQKINKYLSLQLDYNRYSNEFSRSRPYSKNLFFLGVRCGT